MKGIEERLQLIIGPALADPATLRAGDLLNCREDLYDFSTGGLTESGWSGEGRVQHKDYMAWRGGIRIEPVEYAKFQSLSDEEVRSLLRDARSILEALSPMSGKADGEADLGEPDLHIGLIAPTDKAPYLKVSGPLHDAVLFVLVHLLGKMRTKPIARCPECKEIFFRVGKRKYHSIQCETRAHVRRYRQAQESETSKPKRNRRRPPKGSA